MNAPFGPWATAVVGPGKTELDALWKRRLDMLATVKRSDGAWSRRRLLLLAALGLCVLALPTMRLTWQREAVAQDAKESEAIAKKAITARAAPKTPARITYLPEPSRNEIEIHTALRLPVTFEFQDTPLADVVAFLQDYTDVNVVLDPVGLAAASVDTDTPVSLTLRDVSLEPALRFLLHPLDLTFSVVDDVLMITDVQSTDDNFVTRTYLVGALCDEKDEFASLKEVVERTVKPGSWDKNGGSIAPWPASESLVIRQTLSEHAKVFRLLQTLLEARSTSGTAEKEALTEKNQILTAALRDSKRQTEYVRQQLSAQLAVQKEELADLRKRDVLRQRFDKQTPRRSSRFAAKKVEASRKTEKRSSTAKGEAKKAD